MAQTDADTGPRGDEIWALKAGRLLELLEDTENGTPPEEFSRRAIEVIEDVIPNTIGSILEFDAYERKLYLVAAPQLPATFHQSLDGAPIGPFGTCARAALECRVAITDDTRTHPDWNDFQELVDTYGFLAAWSFPLLDSQGELQGTLGLYFDRPAVPTQGQRRFLERCARLLALFIAQHRADRMLAERERRYRQLMATVSDIVYATDSSETLTYLSPAAKSLFGDNLDAMLGRGLEELLGEDHAETLAKACALVATKQEPVHINALSVETAQGRRYLSVTMEKSANDDEEVVGLIRDVTECEQARAELAITDRLSSLGGLAATIAHEVNNPLAAVVGNLEFIVGHHGMADLFPDAKGAVADALEAATRVGRIVNDIRSFSRPSHDEPRSIDPRPDIERAVRLAKRNVVNVAELDVDLHNLAPVVGIHDRITQIIVNLLLNAAQAFTCKTGQPNIVRLWSECSSDEVRIAVQDNGPGVPAEYLGRIFEPFFTTKLSKGTGLGLAISHRLAVEMGGRIDVESSDEGATFTLVLKRPDQGATTQRPRLLVVDDESTLLRMLGRLLEAHYSTTVTESSARALQLAANEAFDLVVLDVMMPEKSGCEVARELFALDPRYRRRVILMTGGAQPPVEAEFAEIPLLNKPFRLADFDAVASKLLEEDHDP